MSGIRFATLAASSQGSAVVAWRGVGPRARVAAMIEDSDGFMAGSTDLEDWLASAVIGDEVDGAGGPLAVVQNVYDRVCIEERRRGSGPIGLSVACVSMSAGSIVYCGVGAIRLWHATATGEEGWVKSQLLLDDPSYSTTLRHHTSVITRLVGPISPRPNESDVRHLDGVARCA